MNDSFIAVYPFMIKELELSGNELLVYALIYSFSRDGQSSFYGSWKYLGDQTGAGRTTISRSLKSLCEKGLVQKEDVIENNIKRCKYYATITRPTNLQCKDNKMVPPGTKMVPNKICTKMVPNKIYNKTEDKIVCGDTGQSTDLKSKKSAPKEKADTHTYFF